MSIEYSSDHREQLFVKDRPLLESLDIAMSPCHSWRVKTLSDVKKLCSIRLAPNVDEELTRHADRLGLSKSAVAESILAKELGIGEEPNITLLKEIRDWLAVTHEGTAFPPDVTGEVFAQIRTNKRLMVLYRQCAEKKKGQWDPKRKQEINKQIGRTVARVLDATVIGRSNPVSDPDHNLVQRFSLLMPNPDA